MIFAGKIQEGEGCSLCVVDTEAGFFEKTYGPTGIAKIIEEHFLSSYKEEKICFSGGDFNVFNLQEGNQFGNNNFGSMSNIDLMHAKDQLDARTKGTKHAGSMNVNCFDS